MIKPKENLQKLFDQLIFFINLSAGSNFFNGKRNFKK